ncbi:hypothetical protein PNA2_1882 [Pyrococcus sp. NA2]|uniref:serine/threonine protein kinase n=1 Tax=Pyrococcus sp. (strain NA2) TaxID=342949 RepID=UPI000209ACEF|nr:serine/threonine protein kinase [Pyrococcus sp. NA2]AEC52797.1 hypothetical protein PNA2_1882 [Pyrococcus sp. NA2]
MIIDEMINKIIDNLNKALGEHGIKVQKFLAKGTTSFVFLGEINGERVIIKYQRGDSPRRNFRREAEILKILEGQDITGRLILYGTIENREVLVREYLEGIHLITSDIEKHHIIKIGEKTYKLDKLGIDHGQIQGGKHILVSPTDIWIIDFEKASTVRRPKNLTSAMAMLFLGNNSISRRVISKFNLTGDFLKEMKDALRFYKKTKDPSRVFELLSTL